jgi:sulfite exporter TauE/SafE
VTSEYSLAFLTGLLGGFGHCLGMCGPLVAAFSLQGQGRPPLWPHLLYNGGRVVTYTFIGALMGLGGSFVNTAGRIAGLQNAVSVLAGLLMVAMGLSIMGVIRYPGRLDGKAGLFTRAAAPVLESDSPLKYFPLGLLLGFLPCGLSYSIFLGAAATGGLLRGFFLALSFGLATVPALFLFGLTVGYLSTRVRGALYRAGGATVVIMGLIFIQRGIASYASL